MESLGGQTNLDSDYCLLYGPGTININDASATDIDNQLDAMQVEEVDVVVLCTARSEVDETMDEKRLSFVGDLRARSGLPLTVFIKVMTLFLSYVLIHHAAFMIYFYLEHTR
jgi:hypothetical protein